MTYGIKISKPGYDVKTCTDDQLVMSSEINTLKTFGSATIKPLESYNHNLGYVPIHLFALYTIPGKKLRLVGQSQFYVIATTTYIENTDIDTENGNSALVYVFYDSL